MTRKLAVGVAAAAIAACLGFASEPASAQIRPHGGGGGGGSMHFAPHGFGGGSMMHFGGRSFAGTRFFHSGGFAHFGAGHYALGRSNVFGGSANHFATFGRGPTTTAGANWSSYHHGWQGWQGYRRGWVGWAGPVFWPYAYDDLFDFAFWPYGPYDDLFWSYGYDDLFAGILLPYALAGFGGGYGYGYGYGGPGYAYAPGRPAAPSSPQTGAGASGGAPAPTSVGQLCGSAQSLAGGAGVDAISRAVGPTGDQGAKLDALKNAEGAAEKTLSDSCAQQMPTTTVARLDAVEGRLQAMIQAANTVSGPLGDFYGSLSDEQKATFNAMGDNKRGAASLAQICGPQNAVPVIATDQISNAVQPDDKQRAALDALRDAAGKADDTILASCPKQAPLTPTGRLDAVKARLQAMVDGLNAVKQPLQDFYASLSDEQKTKFDTLTQPPGALQQNASAPAAAPMMPSPAPTTPPANAAVTPTPSPSQSNVSVAPAAPTTPPQPNASATPTPSPAESNASVTPTPAEPAPGMTPTPEPSATATP